MNYYKKRKPFISLVCAISLIFSMISVPVTAADTNSVTATTSVTVRQGNSAYCYVDIGSTEGLAALDVTVHFDPAKVKIIGVYNGASCTLYDSVTNTDNIQFSYILDGQGTASKTRLFYFQYQVLSNADVGSAYFDITIGEAYDNSLNEMAVSGSRCSFTIAETVTNKSCNVYGSSLMSTAIDQEFTLSYRFSTYQISSGTAVITYDAELFEVVEVTQGAFLTGKVVDINTDLTGEIYISFVGTEDYSNTNLVSVTFRTIKNVTETSKITFKTTELLDKELNSISCSGYTTNVNVVYDETHTGDSPAMRLDGTFSYEDKQITLVVSLEAGSNLGAGDFVITFNPDLVSYNSCTKGFTPSFFNIDDKNVDAGELKFHIISLSDIVTEETVLTVVFDVNHPYGCETADFTLDGTGLTDSLTESILLNLVDASVYLEYQVNFCDSDGTVLQSAMYRYGDIVQEPDAPVKESDVYGTYTFAGWDKPITNCIADTTYIATYTLEYTDYTVTFQDWDGTELSRAIYHYGDTVTLPNEPQREGELNCTYTFVGWDKEISYLCTGNVVYTANYNIHYFGLKLAWDGVTTENRILQVDVVLHGEAMISAGDFEIAYNSKHLVCVNAEADRTMLATGGVLSIQEDIGNGKVTFSYSNSISTNEDTPILHLTFKIIDGFYGEVSLMTSGSNVLDSTFENITLSYKPYTMNLNSIVGLPVSGLLDSYTYTGKAITPTISIEGFDETDYTVNYSDNVNVGTATVTITGKNEYSGTIKKTFEITPANLGELSDVVISGLEERYVYNGEAITPGISIEQFVYGVDYEVSYQNNVNAGIATVIITGIGNYTGTIEKTFTIIARGDINQDGSITTDDAIYLLYYTTSPEDYPIYQNGDLDNNGTVNSDDAIYLLYYTFMPEKYPLK